MSQILNRILKKVRTISNLTYWQRRQVENMFRYMQEAEDVADQIAQLYFKASRFLSYEADEIFERFLTKHKLSEEEARELLNTLQDKSSLEELLNRLRNETQNAEKKELLAKLEAPAYQARLERLRQLQNQIDLVMKNVYQQEKAISTSFYVDLAKEAYYRSVFNIQQQADAAFSFGVVDAKQIDAVINSKWSGRNYSERIWKNTKDLAKTLKEELLINLVTGRTNREVSQIIANKFGQGASNARRLVRTESNYVSGELNFKAYEECGIEKYQFLATLDLRTSKSCRKLDGKIFPVKDRQIGINCNPMHPWCRSTTVSVVNEKYIEKMQRSAIDPATGKRIMVPRSMNYEEWYDKYVKSNPKAQLEEKKIKNISSDRNQYQRYKELLGEKYISKSLSDFQNLKYTNPTEYGILKAQAKGMSYYNKAIVNEPEITEQVKAIGKINGMSMKGLEYRVKDKDSYLRKIRKKYAPSGNTYEVKDIVRYTYSSSPKKLIEKTLKSIESLKNMGYNTIKVKNYWNNKMNPYNGINTTVKAPNGQMFEVQYHTPQSYAVKDTMHKNYEEWRVMDPTTKEAIALRRKMFEQSKSMEIPDGIERM